MQVDGTLQLAERSHLPVVETIMSGVREGCDHVFQKQIHVKFD